MLVLLLLLFQDFRGGVALVHVDADVRRRDQVVDGLTKDDFVVTDNGKRQTIAYFGQQEQPLDVLLLFDTSASMRPVVARVAEAAHMAMGELHAGDRAAIMAFDCRTDLIQDFTEDLSAAERSIGDEVLRREFKRCSPMQKALGEAAVPFLKQPHDTRRRAVVVITDDEGSRKHPGAVEALWGADATVFGVIVQHAGVNIRIGPPGYRGIKRIAEKTGGESVNSADAAQGIAEMLHRLRLRYAVYYAAPQGRPGQEHKIRVELTKDAARRYPGATIRARGGYLP